MTPAHGVSTLAVERVAVRVARDRRLVRVALVVYLLAVLRITQWPQLADDGTVDRFAQLLRWAHAHGLPSAVDVVLVEALANVVMFVPFGILLPLATRLPTPMTVPLGGAFSTAIELSQGMFFPDRVATVQDVVMNTLGAALGALLLHLVLRGAVGRVRRVTSTPPRPSLLAPSTLEPVRIDLARVFWVGTAAWTVALAVMGGLAIGGHVTGRTVAVCAVGALLGLTGVLWSRTRGRTAELAGVTIGRPPEGTPPRR